MTDSPIDMWVEEFDAKTVRRLHRKIKACIDADQKILPIYIDSCGGAVLELGAMQDLIQAAPLVVATIAAGKTWSAGADFLAAGSRGFRAAFPGASIMIHESKDAIGTQKIREVTSDAAEAERVERQYFDRLDANCGKPRGYFEKQLARRKYIDWWMTPKEAKRHGVIDKIGVPLFTTTTTSELKLTFKECK